MKIKRFVGGGLESNGYIISSRSRGGCYIIDPGYEPKRFIDYVESEGLNLLGIILTHHHYDHVGAAARLRDYFDVPVMMHEIDSLRYRGNVDRYLNDGDLLDLDGETLRIFSTRVIREARSAYFQKKARLFLRGTQSLIPTWDGQILRMVLLMK